MLLLFISVTSLFLQAANHSHDSEPVFHWEDQNRFISEGPCAAIIKQRGAERYGYAVLEGVQVLRDTADGPLQIETQEGVDVVSIICSRSSPVPAPYDYRVILSGYDFQIIALPRLDREFEARLTRSDGAFQYVLERGVLTEFEQRTLADMLDFFERQAREEE